ncbi:type II secretion system protein [bacterium]|nr:type II secretion system protein [bacterium]
MFNIKKRAFTLSEILIALVILGVVAMVTIPRTINNSQAKANVLKLKRSYTVIQDAVKIASVRSDYTFADVTALLHNDDNPALRNLQDVLSTALDAPSKAYTEDDAYTGKGEPLSYGNASTQYIPQLGDYNGTASIAAENDLVFTGRNNVLYIIKPKTSMAEGCTANRPCIMYIDINGANKGPNDLVMCTSGTNAIGTLPENANDEYLEPEACTVDESGLTDVYPFFLYDTEVRPATSAVVSVLER